MRTTTLILAAALLLAGCGGADEDPAATSATTTSTTTSTTTPVPGQTTSGSTGRTEDESHDHDSGEDPGHLDIACEAELAAMQGDDSGAKVLSASVTPGLTCQEAVPAVRALDAAAPFGEAPATLEAESFTCETSTDEFEGQPIEVFRCEDDRGTLVWVRG